MERARRGWGAAGELGAAAEGGWLQEDCSQLSVATGLSTAQPSQVIVGSSVRHRLSAIKFFFS